MRRVVPTCLRGQAAASTPPPAAPPALQGQLFRHSAWGAPTDQRRFSTTGPALLGGRVLRWQRHPLSPLRAQQRGTTLPPETPGASPPAEPTAAAAAAPTGAVVTPRGTPVLILRRRKRAKKRVPPVQAEDHHHPLHHHSDYLGHAAGEAPSSIGLFREYPTAYEVSVADSAVFAPEKVVANKAGDFTWHDVDGRGSIDAFKRQAAETLSELGLPQALFDEVSGSEVLPMYQTEGQYTVFVLRLSNYQTVRDAEKTLQDELRPVPVTPPTAKGAHQGESGQAWSVSDLTNRLTIVVDSSTNRVITLHAHKLSFMGDTATDYERRVQKRITIDGFVWGLVLRLLQEHGLSNSVNKAIFDKMEQAFISTAQAGKLLTGRGISKGVYGVMRRSSVGSRVLKATVAMLHDVKLEPPAWAPDCAKTPAFRRVAEKAHQSLSFTDELQASAKDLLTLHFGTASHQTNELVKVFNILSATFMPLSFLVGFYGMNFSYLPGTEQVCGIDGVWFMVAFLLFTATSFIQFFRIKGWL